jgi:cell wall-associated NlpC family hydrolase
VQNLRQALHAYNHADWYVNEVLDYASQYAAAAETATTPAFAASVVESARTQLGSSYVFGGCSRAGVDCSCLVQLVYRQFGVNLPRTAAE